MRIGPSFGDAMDVDQAIYQLAAYDSANGMIIIPESQEQALAFQKKVISRFNYFKRLLQNAELTFMELQRSVIDRNGPFPNKNRKITIEQSIEKMINAPKETEADYQKDDRVAGVLQKLFGDIAFLTGQNPNLAKDQEDDEMLKSQINDSFNPYDIGDGVKGRNDSHLATEGLENTKEEPKNKNKEDSNVKGKNGRIKKTHKNPKTRKGKNDTL